VGRMAPEDAAFLEQETPLLPMHAGEVALFDGGRTGVDADRITQLIAERIALVPRYRQRVQPVPWGLAQPVWVDDTSFDLATHVRRAALPQPGTEEQLCELVARLMSRPLDRAHPLWEVYLVEGLAPRRFALVSKTHHALVDGVTALDLLQVLLEATAEPAAVATPRWQAAPPPGPAELLAGAVVDLARDPRAALRAAAGAAAAGANLALGVARSGARMGGTVAGVVRTSQRTPFNVEVTGQRRFAMVDTDLEVYRGVRRSRQCTINDVVLAVVTGALRRWLLSRGSPVTSGTIVRAVVPVRVSDPDQPGVDRGQVTHSLVDLPVGEPMPLLRLTRIAFDMAHQRQGLPMIEAQAMVSLAGFGPPTLHRMGARVAATLRRRGSHVTVVNVPGPQHRLYAAGSPMVRTYPVVPLTAGQALSIGATSYDGRICYGLNADRSAVADLGLLQESLIDALAELSALAGRR